MTAQADRLLSALVTRIDCPEGIANIGPEVEAARRYLAGQRAKRQRVAAKSKPRRATEAEAAANEEERHRRFVMRVVERDGYRCQLCADPDGPGPLDPHHLEPGPNKIKHEKMSNVLTAHRSCHEAAHRNEAAFVEPVKAWAAKHGYPLPARKVYR